MSTVKKHPTSSLHDSNSSSTTMTEWSWTSASGGGSSNNSNSSSDTPIGWMAADHDHEAQDHQPQERDHHQQQQDSPSSSSPLPLTNFSSRRRRRQGGSTEITDEFRASLLKTSASKRRNSSSMLADVSEELTVNKLQFASLGLYGREKEVSILHECLARVSTTTRTKTEHQQEQQQPRKELVLISGASGCGKSALAETLKDEAEKRGGIFARGKFDQRRGGRDKSSNIHQNNDNNNNNEPYSTIAQACEQICQKIIMLGMSSQKKKQSHHPSQDESSSSSSSLLPSSSVEQNDDSIARVGKLDQFRSSLLHTLVGMEVDLLVHVVPMLREILGQDENKLQKNKNGAAKKDDQAIVVDNPLGDNNNNNIMSIKKDLIQSAFCKFFAVVCDWLGAGPCVMVLDDLQWADVGTLDMIQALLLTMNAGGMSGGLMVVGCYRSNNYSQNDEADPHDDDDDSTNDTQHNHNNTLLRMIQKLRWEAAAASAKSTPQRQGSSKYVMTEISIGNLGVRASNHILMTLLGTDDASRTRPLAELCHRRTLGNALFLIHFISMLQQEDFLVYNLGLMAWTWDVSRIEQETAATANVVDVMKEKMLRLSSTTSEELVSLLKLAACLGSTFDKKLLELVWNNSRAAGRVTHQQPEHDRRHDRNQVLLESKGSSGDEAVVLFESLLERAVEESFLEKAVGTTAGVHHHHRLRFVHDKVQESAMSLIPADEFARLQHQVGMGLLRQLHDDLETNIFVVVNLLNKGSTKSMELAELNLLAAEKAQKCAAFASAAAFAAKGIDNLHGNDEISPQDDHNSKAAWCGSSSKLTLQLYAIGAEAESCVGNKEKMEKYCKVVLEHPKYLVFDKLRCYRAMIDSMGSRSRPREAMNLSLDVLHQLGCKFPRNVVSQAVGAILALFTTRPPLEEAEVSQMPLMSDSAKIQAMKLIDKAGTYAYVAKNPMVFLLGTCRMIRMTTQYGLAEESPAAFASFGVLSMHVMGDWKTGIKITEIALSMLERLELRYKESFTILFCRCMLQGWVNPMPTTIKYAMDGYEKGMASGDIEGAMSNLLTYVTMSFLSGKPLPSVEEDCQTYTGQMDVFKQEESAAWQKILWQLVQNLMDQLSLLSHDESSTVELTGKVLNENEFIQHAESNNADQQLIVLQLYKSYARAFFGKYQEEADLALSRGDGYYLQKLAGAPVVIVEPFLRGLCFYAAARSKTGLVRRRYKRAGNRARSTVRCWLQQGNPNVAHHLKILDAEKAALKGQRADAVMLYVEAVRLAVRGGFIQDAAIANERHADYLLEIVHDVEGAAYHVKEAIKYYTEWGASRLARILCRKHETLLEVHQGSR